MGALGFVTIGRKLPDILFSIDLYGELRGSEVFAAVFKFLKKVRTGTSRLYNNDFDPEWFKFIRYRFRQTLQSEFRCMIW